MHVLQWIAVEAEDVENAVTTVDQTLESYMSGNDSLSTWYDWYVVGGGRWNIAEDEDWKSGYDTKTNMVIAFEDNPNAFRAKIDECVQSRIDEYNRYLAEVKESNVMEKLDTYGGAMSYSPEVYALNALLRFQTGEWHWDSKFFDMIADSTNATHILSKIDNGLGESFYLVPVDFHF